MMQYLLRALRFRRDFGNPVSIALCRRFFPDRALTVVDRRSGVKVRCAAGSSRIFGETWHDRDYDIPRLPLRRGDIVIDIGANQGFFACYAAWHGARVYAFEPQATALDRLLANARLNHLEEHITARPWAVSGTAGELELSITRGGGGGFMSSVKPEFIDNAGVTVEKRCQVKAVTLPMLMREFALERIRLCKLDCEGSELDILRALADEQIRQLDAMVIEYHPEAYPVQELAALLLSWGTHQVSFAEDKYCERQILRAVANAALLGA